VRQLLKDVFGALVVLLGTCLFLLITWLGVAFLKGLFFADEGPAKWEWPVFSAFWGSGVPCAPKSLAGPREISDALERQQSAGLDEGLASRFQMQSPVDIA
jgi:hypothetical protein